MKFRRGEIVTVQQKTIGIRDSMSPKREGIISPGTVGTVRAVSTRKLIGIPEKSVLVDFPSLIDERWVRPGDLQHGNPGAAYHRGRAKVFNDLKHQAYRTPSLSLEYEMRQSDQERDAVASEASGMANPTKGQPITLKCNFCGKVFKRSIGPKTYEIKCSKCGEYDVEPLNANPRRKPQWRKKGESLTHFEQRRGRYVDRVIGDMTKKRNPTRTAVTKSIIPWAIIGGLAWLIYKYRS